MYSLILTDIDGTLLKDDLTISEKTILAFRKAREKGIGIVLCSGRYLHGIQFLKEELAIDDAILSGINGALIKHGEKYLNSVTLGVESYEKAAAILKGRCKSLIAFSESKYAIECVDSFYSMQYNICRQKGIRMDLRSHKEVEKALGERIYKLLVKDDDSAQCQLLLEELRMKMGAEVEIISSHPSNFEILPKGTDKSNSVSILSRELGIPKERMIAFGDWDNDAGMLASVGMGIAMANGSDRAKAAASFITKDNNSDGIYYALKHLNVI